MTLQKILSAALASTVAFSGLVSSQEAYRSWRSADGKVIEAAFLGMDGENVKIKARNGA